MSYGFAFEAQGRGRGWGGGARNLRGLCRTFRRANRAATAPNPNPVWARARNAQIRVEFRVLNALGAPSRAQCTTPPSGTTVLFQMLFTTIAMPV